MRNKNSNPRRGEKVIHLTLSSTVVYFLKCQKVNRVNKAFCFVWKCHLITARTGRNLRRRNDSKYQFFRYNPRNDSQQEACHYEKLIAYAMKGMFEDFVYESSLVLLNYCVLVPSRVMPTRMVHLEIDQRAIKGMTNKTLDRQTSLVADSWIIVPVSCWSVSEVITSNATA